MGLFDSLKKRNEINKENMNFLRDNKWQINRQNLIKQYLEQYDEKILQYEGWFHDIEDEINRINQRFLQMQMEIKELKDLFKFHQTVLEKGGFKGG